MKHKISSMMGLLLIMVITFLVYREALNNEFLNWDTQIYVTDNPNIKAINGQTLWWMLTSFHAANWHPLTWLSHAIDYAFYGLEPWGHHLTSLFIHCLNTLLVFVLTFRLLKTTSFPPNQIFLAASVSAWLFGIHPQHVESVVWIAERKDVLCLFFVLLASITYLMYTSTAKRSWYLGTLGLFGLALLSKPMAVTFPVVLILIDNYPLRRGIYQHLWEKIPFFILSGISSILTILAQSSFGAITTTEQMSIQFRLLNAFNSFILYLSKFAFPIILSPYYPPSPWSSFYSYSVPIIAFILISLICGYFWLKKHAYCLTSWLFYVVTLLPVIGIIQVGGQAAADRYAYLPTLPFYLLVGVGWAKLWYATKWIRISGTILLLGASSLLALLTHQQTLIWRNDVTLWQYAVFYDPDSPGLHHRLGNAYQRNGEYDKALAHYLLIQKMNVKGNSKQLALTYLKMNQVDKALDIYQTMLDKSIDIDEDFDEICYKVGWIYDQQGQRDKAKQWINKALTINPHHLLAQKLLKEMN